VNQAAWIDAFVIHMSRVGSRGSPEVLNEMALARWHTNKTAGPVKKA